MPLSVLDSCFITQRVIFVLDIVTSSYCLMQGGIYILLLRK